MRAGKFTTSYMWWRLSKIKYWKLNWTLEYILLAELVLVCGTHSDYQAPGYSDYAFVGSGLLHKYMRFFMMLQYR